MKENSRIYFEDPYCAVVYKKTGEDSQTFFSALFPQKTFVAAVNRLDTPVSGLVLLAFSAKVQTLFSHAFTAGEIQKEYWAICERCSGTVEPQVKMAAAAPEKTMQQVTSGTAEFTDREKTEMQMTPGNSAFEKPTEQTGSVHFQRLEHLVGFHTKTQKAFIVGEPSKNLHAHPYKRTRNNTSAKKALLYWALCGAGERYDFICIRPETGRTHQIRVQMAAIGRPIKGDLKYGARRSEVGGGIRLHSFRLHVIHPITGSPIRIEAAPQEPDTLWSACMAACSPNKTYQDEMISSETY